MAFNWTEGSDAITSVSSQVLASISESVTEPFNQGP